MFSVSIQHHLGALLEDYSTWKHVALGEDRTSITVAAGFPLDMDCAMAAGCFGEPAMRGAASVRQDWEEVSRMLAYYSQAILPIAPAILYRHF